MKHLDVELAICMPDGTWHTEVVYVVMADYLADSWLIILSVAIERWSKNNKDCGQVAIGLYGYRERE